MKNKVENVLLCIFLIPYIIILFMCIYYGITGYGYCLDGNTAYGFIAIQNYFGQEVFIHLISLFLWNPIIIVIILVCGCYQLCYRMYNFITVKGNNKEGSENYKDDKNSKNKSINLKKIIFFISISCWIIYLASGIFAFIFGSNTGDGYFSQTMEYGMNALLKTLFLNLIYFSFIPVLPISLMYIIIYLVFGKAKKKNQVSNINN